MENPIKRVIKNLRSLVKDGRTLGQKRRYIHEYHPRLYHYLFEEDQETGEERLKW